MSEHDYPMPVRKLVKILADICRHQERMDLLEVLENSHGRLVEIDYDNWNGGTYTYRLQLELTVAIFATCDTKIDVMEKKLLGSIGSIDKAYDNDHIGEVLITPATEDSSVFGQRFSPAEIEIEHLWDKGFFKLFLSHIVEHKVKVRDLKISLKSFGISAFVAHEDIQPSKEWQNEIELALRSMDSLTALVTPGFLESRWCDQEVGWALGRGVPVVPVRLGCDPHGFSGKFQAIPGTLDKHTSLAHSIFDTLKKKSETSRAIYRALPRALVISKTFNHSLILAPIITEYQEYTDSEKEILWKACQDNFQVYNAHGVRKAIYSHIGKPPEEEAEEDNIPF